MIFSKKKKYRLNLADLSEKTEYLVNPSVGWYHIYPFCLNEEPDFEELFWCLKKTETLALILVNIAGYRRQPIADDAVERFRKILDFFVKNKKELILRITYDMDGSCAEKEPEFISQIQSHMKALGPVMQEYQEHILVVQGLCIGNWGEMHGSKYLIGNNLKKLFRTWREALGENIPIAVRTPLQWRRIHDEAEAREKEIRTGVFNDGMFGSADDLGTYKNRDMPMDDVGEEDLWTQAWPREKELVFLNQRINVPYGGEAVGESAEGELQKAVKELRQTHAAYLNRAHDPKRLALWEKETWKSGDVWEGVDGCTYIGCHLGYRLVVRTLSLTGKKTQKLTLELENTGFAPFALNSDFIIMVFKEDGSLYAEQKSLMPGIGAGEKQVFEFLLEDLLKKNIAENEPVLHIKVQIQDFKGNCIRLANAPDTDYMELGTIVEF